MNDIKKPAPKVTISKAPPPITPIRASYTPKPSDNDRPPRWSKWKLMPEVKLWEAIALSLNIEPKEIKLDSDAYGYEVLPFDEGEEFNDRLTVLSKHSSNRTYFPTACTLNFATWYQSEKRLDEFAAWCIQIGFDIPEQLATLANNKPQAESAPKVGAVPATSPSVDDWKEQARTIANECFDKDTASGCRDSLKGYSKRVMEIMQERSIKGVRGIIDNENYVMREALQGKKWWANKIK